MSNSFHKKKYYINIKKILINYLLILIYISPIQVFSMEYYKIESINIPNCVLNYAKRHNLKIEIEKYNIDKTDVKNGDKYKYIFPCVNKQGNVYAILYKNIFYIKTAKPQAYDQLYFDTR